MSWKYRLKSAVSSLSSSKSSQNHSASTSGPPAIPPRLPSRLAPLPPSKLPPAVIRSLRLLSKCMLEASICLPGGGETIQCRFHLDDVLGNDNGNFSTTGKHFSQSSRNVRLVDYSLWAELASMDGRWQYDVVGLALTLPIEKDQKLQVQIVDYNAAYSPSLASPTSRLSASTQEDVRNLRLISGFLLTADCLQPDGSYASSFLDLDGYIGNSSGNFSRGVNFTESSQDISLVSTTLSGWLSTNGGALQHSSMDISRNVRCLNGRLIAFNGLRSEDDYPPMSVHSLLSVGQLSGCESVRLVNGSILLAIYCTSKGSLRECAFKLRKIFGVADGQLRPFGHNFTPGSAKNLHFSGSILSIDVEQPAKNDYSNENKSRSYREYIVDLEDYVVFEDGRLKLRHLSNKCSACASAFRAGKLFSPWNETHRERIFSLDSLEINADCGLCQLARKIVHATHVLTDDVEISIETTSKSDFYAEAVELDIRKGSSSNRYKLFLNKDLSTENYAFNLVPQRKLSEDWFNPAKRWSLASSWIEDCLHNHKACFQSEALLPTRCLDIGIHAGDRVQVITTSNVLGRYACLSYCWGKADLNKLTSETIATYLEEIPKADLPSTYKDAIIVCQYLGIRYLWIDSLCILQDSKEDWLWESSQMSAYYGHCYICIAATNLASPDSSLNIADRPVAISADGKDAHGAAYSLFAYPSDKLDNLPHFSRAESDTLDEHFPLMRRAWVFQERLLAPRTLHFAGSEILFECANGLSCECGQASKNYWINIGDSGRRMNMEAMADGAVLRRRPPESLRWTQYVVAYSYLKLSYAMDRLPAISGLARDYVSRRPKQHPGQYLAGLWRNNIYGELVWFVGAPLLRHRARKVIRFQNEEEDEAKFTTTQKQRVREYIAPSWSWASVFEAVNYRAPEDNRPLCEVLDAFVSLNGDDEFGSVSDGCLLKVKGRLARTSWTAISNGSASVPYMLTSMIGSQQMDLDDSQGIRFLPDYTITAPDGNQISRTEEVFVLPVLSQKVSLIGYSYDGNHAKMDAEKDRINRIRNTLCLVLRRQSGHGESDLTRYERVGFTEYVNVVGAVENIDPNDYQEAVFTLV